MSCETERKVAPKPTFFNLPAEKRERIVRAAVAEFAASGYTRASLNTIVRKAGISKGSLYQYFEDKEALFLYLFDHFTLLVKQAVRQADSPLRRQDFFASARRVVEAGFAFIDRHPDYFELYLKVLFEHDVPHREMLIRRVRLFSGEYFAPLCEEAKRCGMVRSDLPTSVIVFLLDAVIDRLLTAYAKSYLASGFEFSAQNGQAAAFVDGVLDALQNGVVISCSGD